MSAEETTEFFISLCNNYLLSANSSTDTFRGAEDIAENRIHTISAPRELTSHIGTRISRQRSIIPQVKLLRPDALQPVVLNWGRFGMSRNIFGCHSWGDSYWHPGGGGPGCCLTSCNAQDSPPWHRIIEPVMPVVPRFGSLVGAFRLRILKT